jgi:hypothetical protein
MDLDWTDEIVNIFFLNTHITLNRYSLRFTMRSRFGQARFESNIRNRNHE